MFGTFLYSLTLLSLHKNAQDIVKNNGLAAAFVDDAFVAGMFKDICSVIDMMDSDGINYGYVRHKDKGMYLLGKCGDWQTAITRRNILIDKYKMDGNRVHIHPDDVASRYGRNIEFEQAMGRYGANILGSFIGSDAYTIHQLKGKLKELREESQKLISNCSTQDCSLLFLRCFNYKSTYLMRTIPPKLLEGYIKGFRSVQRTIIQQIMQVEEIDSKTWTRMKLPINQSGLGLGFLEESSNAAYVSSLIGVQDSVASAYPILKDDNINQIPMIAAMKEAITTMNSKIPNLSWTNVWGLLAEGNKTLQGSITDKLIKGKMEEFLESINDKHDMVIIRATIDDNAGAWLNVIPKWEHLIMTNAQMVVSYRNRFNLYQTISPVGVCCDCSAFKQLDDKGVHLQNCPKGGGKQRRHDDLVNYISRMANHAGMRCRMEVRNELNQSDPNCNLRPDLTFHQGTATQRKLQADVTVTHPLSGRNNPGCNGQSHALISTLGWAANAAANNKINKYRAICNQNDSSFIPLVFESTGHMHKDVLDLINIISSHASDTRKIPIHILRCYHINALSVILQKSTADGMIRRSAQLQGSALTQAARYVMTHDEIMGHDRAFVYRSH